MESFYGDPTMQNTSGQGEHSIVPEEIKRWNWGAFFLGWIWGIGNSVWISFLGFIPIVNFVIPFVLGAKGSEWAWKNKQWESVDHFLNVQKKWAKWGFIIFIIMVVIGLLSAAAIIAFIWSMVSLTESYDGDWINAVLQMLEPGVMPTDSIPNDGGINTIPNVDPNFNQDLY